MKRMECIAICMLIALSTVQSQKLPEFVQQRIDSLKDVTKNTLVNYRTLKVNVNERLPQSLGFFSSSTIFTYDETLLIDSLGLNISISMIYDDEMRDRVVQLIRNEYRQDELDILVYRGINPDMRDVQRNEIEVMKTIGIDTMQVFRNSLDSLYADLEIRNEIDLWKKRDRIYDHEILKQLHLDTTTLFKHVYNNILESQREQLKSYYLSNIIFDRRSLIDLCGYINDIRFVDNLLELFNTFTENEQESVQNALVRMRVEPFFCEYVNKRMLSMEEILNKVKQLDFSINDFVNVLGTQEAFLELSKYLLSNKPYGLEIGDYSSIVIPVSQYAFYLLRDNILNNDFQKLFGGRQTANNPVLANKLYDWMQENYGQYQIRRIW